MIPCISQAVTLATRFDGDLRAVGDAGCHAVEVWLTKLETFLETQAIDDAVALARDRELELPVAAVQGGIVVSQGEARREAFALFDRRLALCAALAIRTLVVVADFVDEVTESDYERAVVSLKDAARRAAGHGVRLALEFLGRSRFCNNLSTAASLVEQCGEPNLGLCLDVFHYYTGPSKFEDLGLLTGDNLFHVQLCDLAGTPRELASDSDRVLPGDGDFQLLPIVEHLRSIGYAGAVSVELMNPRLAMLPPEQVAEVAITALRKLLGQAAS